MSFCLARFLSFLWVIVTSSSILSMDTFLPYEIDLFDNKNTNVKMILALPYLSLNVNFSQWTSIFPSYFGDIAYVACSRLVITV